MKRGIAHLEAEDDGCVMLSTQYMQGVREVLKGRHYTMLEYGNGWSVHLPAAELELGPAELELAPAAAELELGPVAELELAPAAAELDPSPA